MQWYPNLAVDLEALASLLHKHVKPRRIQGKLHAYENVFYGSAVVDVLQRELPIVLEEAQASEKVKPDRDDRRKAHVIRTSLTTSKEIGSDDGDDSLVDYSMSDVLSIEKAKDIATVLLRTGVLVRVHSGGELGKTVGATKSKLAISKTFRIKNSMYSFGLRPTAPTSGPNDHDNFNFLVATKRILIVSILRATNLIPKGAHGTCDSYVSISVAGQSARTIVKTNDLNPVWGRSRDEKSTFLFIIPQNQMKSGTLGIHLKESKMVVKNYGKSIMALYHLDQMLSDGHRKFRRFSLDLYHGSDLFSVGEKKNIKVSHDWCNSSRQFTSPDIQNAGHGSKITFSIWLSPRPVPIPPTETALTKTKSQPIKYHSAVENLERYKVEDQKLKSDRIADAKKVLTRHLTKIQSSRKDETIDMSVDESSNEIRKAKLNRMLAKRKSSTTKWKDFAAVSQQSKGSSFDTMLNRIRRAKSRVVSHLPVIESEIISAKRKFGREFVFQNPRIAFDIIANAGISDPENISTIECSVFGSSREVLDISQWTLVAPLIPRLCPRFFAHKIFDALTIICTGESDYESGLASHALFRLPYNIFESYVSALQSEWVAFLRHQKSYLKQLDKQDRKGRRRRSPSKVLSSFHQEDNKKQTEMVLSDCGYVRGAVDNKASTWLSGKLWISNEAIVYKKKNLLNSQVERNKLELAVMARESDGVLHTGFTVGFKKENQSLFSGTSEFDSPTGDSLFFENSIGEEEADKSKPRVNFYSVFRFSNPSSRSLNLVIIQEVMCFHRFLRLYLYPEAKRFGLVTVTGLGECEHTGKPHTYSNNVEHGENGIMTKAVELANEVLLYSVICFRALLATQDAKHSGVSTKATTKKKTSAKLKQKATFTFHSDVSDEDVDAGLSDDEDFDMYGLYEGDTSRKLGSSRISPLFFFSNAKRANTTKSIHNVDRGLLGLLDKRARCAESADPTSHLAKNQRRPSVDKLFKALAYYLLCTAGMNEDGYDQTVGASESESLRRRSNKISELAKQRIKDLRILKNDAEEMILNRMSNLKPSKGEDGLAKYGVGLVEECYPISQTAIRSDRRALALSAAADEVWIEELRESLASNVASTAKLKSLSQNFYMLRDILEPLIDVFKYWSNTYQTVSTWQEPWINVALILMNICIVGSGLLQYTLGFIPLYLVYTILKLRSMKENGQLPVLYIPKKKKRTIIERYKTTKYRYNFLKTSVYKLNLNLLKARGLLTSEDTYVTNMLVKALLILAFILSFVPWWVMYVVFLFQLFTSQLEFRQKNKGKVWNFVVNVWERVPHSPLLVRDDSKKEIYSKLNAQTPQEIERKLKND